MAANSMRNFYLETSLWKRNKNMIWKSMYTHALFYDAYDPWNIDNVVERNITLRILRLNAHNFP